MAIYSKIPFDGQITKTGERNVPLGVPERVKLGTLAGICPRRMPVLPLQIDHFFAQGIDGADGGVLGSIASDHFTIKGRLQDRRNGNALIGKTG